MLRRSSGEGLTLAVFGASGPTGRELMSQAASRGCNLRVLVRDPTSFRAAGPEVTVIAGEVRDSQAVHETLKQNAAVILALGCRSLRPEDQALAAGTGTILAAMKDLGLERLLVVSCFPLLGGWTNRSLIDGGMGLLARLMARVIVADKRAQERLIRQSGLAWTLVRPVHLMNGPLTGRYRWGERERVRTGARISRADLADFLLNAVDDASLYRRTVTLVS